MICALLVVHHIHLFSYNICTCSRTYASSRAKGRYQSMMYTQRVGMKYGIYTKGIYRMYASSRAKGVKYDRYRYHV